MQWIQGGLFLLLIIVVAWGLNLYAQSLLKRFERNYQLNREGKKTVFLGIRFGFLSGLIRFLIGFCAVLIGVRQVPQLAPIKELFKQIFFTLLEWFNQVVNHSFDVGTGNEITVVTLFAIIGIAILIFFVANFLGRWIKQEVLSKTRIERGSQEAIATLISYVVAIFGFIILLQSMGLDLSSLTVFAGVLGIGFGLGLQELAKNFVSGLTLLFEQQLRVGDFVDVDGVQGTIEEISIRSTILRTQDRLFVVLPNHRFFEKDVTNWSYKTPESRIHIPVNVAYGTDTLLVTEALIDVARHEPKVLKYPAPHVWFKNFGESALEFELLVWINQPQEYWPIRSALNFAIELEFRRRGIGVPFPQREVWLRQQAPPSPAPPSDYLPQKAPSSVDNMKRSVPLSKRNLRQLLRGVSYFNQCSNAQLLLLIEQGFRHHYKKGEIVFRENEPGECFYLILTGKVEVYSEKLEKLLATLATGEFFGEISLFTGIERSATVKTLEETTLFVVDRRALKQLMRDYNELAEKIAETLSERQHELESLGLSSENHTASDSTIFSIRSRIKTLFGI